MNVKEKCWFCNNFDFKSVKIYVDKRVNKARVSLMVAGEASEKEQMKYCPICGRKL